jgi:hypothetical protein
MMQPREDRGGDKMFHATTPTLPEYMSITLRVCNGGTCFKPYPFIRERRASRVSGYRALH